jgi:hypothetical protein
VIENLNCESLRERMPEVVHGRAPWRAAELDHLAACPECQAEWQLVERAAMLHRDVVVDSGAIAKALTARIAALPAEGTTVTPMRPRRLSAGWGLLAAAATVALVFGLRRDPATSVVAGTPTEVTALLPELDGLNEAQLEAVLADVEVTDEGVTPMRLPRLGDLTEAELESLLNELEG